MDCGEKAEARHVPTAWHTEHYEEDEFESLSMKSAGARDDANDERLQRMNGFEPAAAAAAADAAAPQTPQDRMHAYFDRMDTGVQRGERLRFSDGAEADGLPVYAEAAARQMADRTPSPPVDSDVSATESEIRRDIERARNRYVDDEAEESDN